MAVTSTPISCSAKIVTNKGTDASTGAMIKGSVPISGLAAGADNTKVYNVAALLSACIAHSAIQITKTETVELENE